MIDTHDSAPDSVCFTAAGDSDVTLPRPRDAVYPACVNKGDRVFLGDVQVTVTDVARFPDEFPATVTIAGLDAAGAELVRVYDARGWVRRVARAVPSQMPAPQITSERPGGAA